MLRLSEKTFKILLVLCIVCFIVALIMFIIMDFTNFGLLGLNKENGNKGLIDALFYYDSSALHSYISETSLEGRNIVLSIHKVDYVFMTFVLLTEVLCAILVSSKTKKYAIFAIGFAICEFIADIVENVCVDKCILAFPREPANLATMAGNGALVKWIFTILFCVTIIAFLIYYFAVKIKNRKSQE